MFDRRIAVLGLGFGLAWLGASPGAAAVDWWALRPSQRGVEAALSGSGSDRTLDITVREPSRKINVWASLPAPPAGWDLSPFKSVQAEITNQGAAPQPVSLWVVGRNGWDGATDSAILQPHETRTFTCQLQDGFPDGTPKLDPHRVAEVRIISRGAELGTVLEVHDLRTAGEALPWKAPAGRLAVPEMQTGKPAAGQRVRYQLAGDQDSGVYCVLYLPPDRAAGKKYPVIAEYPGNIFFAKHTFSTGRPEQCVLGYGMTKGEGAIWVSLPFVDRKTHDIVEDGWGNADQTADYAVAVIEDVCRNFGGKPDNVVLAGFSRGAIACGYIGLRNDRIAALWKGLQQCQHFDGDGWNGAKLDDALIRAKRFHGKAIFETDQPQASPKLKAVLAATGAPISYGVSGLKAHACAMFLDDRTSAVQLRQWFQDLVND